MSSSGATLLSNQNVFDENHVSSTGPLQAFLRSVPKRMTIRMRKKRQQKKYTVFALMIFISSLILAIISLALQTWVTQETDRYQSRLGLVQRCHRLKIPPLEEECYSSISVNCDDEDYISQAGPMKQANCKDTVKALQLCLALMGIALVVVLAAVLLSVPGPRRHTTIASVCGFIAGVLFLVALGIFRYLPKEDFAYTYFEGKPCSGPSFGLAGGAMFTAFCGGVVSAIVSWQERSIAAEKEERDRLATTNGWTKDSYLHIPQSLSVASVNMALPSNADDELRGTEGQGSGNLTSSLRHRHAESSM